MPKTKIQQDAIKYLESIVEIATMIKTKIENEDMAIDSITLDDIAKVDDGLELVHFYLIENN